MKQNSQDMWVFACKVMCSSLMHSCTHNMYVIMYPHSTFWLSYQCTVCAYSNCMQSLYVQSLWLHLQVLLVGDLCATSARKFEL